MPHQSHIVGGPNRAINQTVCPNLAQKCEEKTARKKVTAHAAVPVLLCGGCPRQQDLEREREREREREMSESFIV